VWCTSFISLYEEYANSVENALGWLDGQKHSDGSWGRTRRDIGRIPTTGLILNLIPRLSSELSLEWLENQWKRETEFEPVMTYKAAFVLMAFKANNYQSPDHSFILKVIDLLSGQQNDDFGWGPYKNHPINSTPYCTGVSLLGLLQYPQNVPEDVFRKGLNWLLENQIPEGLWADHYIEEGSSWALYALTQILSYLSHSGN
jgi:squalene cyclase